MASYGIPAGPGRNGEERPERRPQRRRRRRVIEAADLFCGAGGTSNGLRRACRRLGHDVRLTAINHWPRAIETHRLNDPEARHICERLERVDPRHVVPGGRLDLLIASPECTHHSRARGGKPVSDQQRASAWIVLRWAEALYVPEHPDRERPRVRDLGTRRPPRPADPPARGRDVPGVPRGPPLARIPRRRARTDRRRLRRPRRRGGACSSWPTAGGGPHGRRPRTGRARRRPHTGSRPGAARARS